MIEVYDNFTISGPNGSHHCFVLPILGPSLQKYKVIKGLSGPSRHRVCKQIASAVSFLHHNGICHGDLTPSNILFELPEIQSTDHLYHLLGPIKTEKLRTPKHSSPSHRPKRIVEAPDFSGLDNSLLSNTRIADFGEAFFAIRPPRSLGVPIDFFQPEICFGYMPSAASDIWSLACVIYKIHSSAFLFPTFFRIFEILVGTAVSYLGPLPDKWKGRFEFEEYGYREEGVLQTLIEPMWWFEDKPPEKSIDSRLSQEGPHLSIGQREAIVRLLHEMVKYEPEKRLSAAKVVEFLEALVF